MIPTILSSNKWELSQTFGSIYEYEEARAVIDCLKDWAPTNGINVRQFEKSYAEKMGAAYAVATNSWGSAAHLVAILMDIQPGDEVIIPAIAFQGSGNLFAREGARIVFTESCPRTFNLDPNRLEEKITPKTRAIVTVHMYGQPCDMEPIQEIARKYNLLVIQDAAHAPGAEYKGKKLGELGDFALYSFQQAKNISTLGEGGIVITNNKEWAEKLRKLRSHGMGQYIGISCRMIEMQGAVGLIQLKKMDRQNEIRRRLAYYLNEKFKDIEGIIIPYELPDIKHVYHLYNILVDEKKLGMTRDELIKELWKKKRIMAITYHPTVNCLPCYVKLGHGPGECPISEEIASRTIALPISPRFTENDMDELISGIKSVIHS